MKLIIGAGLLLSGILAAGVGAANGAASDSLTALPLPNEGTLNVSRAPMNLPDVPVCKSKAQMNFYTPSSGKVDAAVAWYTSHLAGFKHTHGYGSGRSQDTFYNAQGTLIVSITGSPAPEGQNTDVYSIIYGTITPGASDKAIAGMNVQKAVCP
jgi:hypothetical protein